MAYESQKEKQNLLNKEALLIFKQTYVKKKKKKLLPNTQFTHTFAHGHAQSHQIDVSYYVGPSLAQQCMTLIS